MSGFLKAAAISAVLLASSSLAAQSYTANFVALNGSGVNGTAMLDLNRPANTLTVTFDISGLDPNGGHVAHIHGLFGANGQPANSTTPTMAQDTDGDGFIEVPEGAATYGDILVPLGDIGSSSTGFSTFSMTYNLLDQATFNNGYTADDLFPLDLREIVIHGLTVPAGPGAGTPGEINGTNGYVAALPVASAEIMLSGMGAVPEPATWLMLIAGFGVAGSAMRSTRRRSALKTA